MFITQVFLIALRVFLRFMTFFCFLFFLGRFFRCNLISFGGWGGTGKFDQHGGLVLLTFLKSSIIRVIRGVTGWVPQFL